VEVLGGGWGLSRGLGGGGGVLFERGNLNWEGRGGVGGRKEKKKGIGNDRTQTRGGENKSRFK